MSEFGADEIRILEALSRSVAHLSAACELYGMGRKPDALLQSARPITDILPALEMELRSADKEMSGFFTAVAQIGAEIRANAKPRAVRRSLKNVQAAGRELTAALFGPPSAPSGPEYDASIGVALLDHVPDVYRRAVEEENLGEYQSAYAIADAGTETIYEAHDGRIATLNELVRALDALLPSVEPPEKLARPEAIETLVESICEVAVQELGAIRVTWTMADSVKRLERLLADVVDAYAKDLGPLAARLASSLFVRAYDPIRHDIAAAEPDVEARLTSLLGFELRRAINDAASVDHIRELAAEAGGLLATLRTQPTTKRDTSPGPG